MRIQAPLAIIKFTFFIALFVIFEFSLKHIDHNYLELSLGLTNSDAHCESFYTMNFPFLKNSNSLLHWLEYLNLCAYFIYVYVCAHVCIHISFKITFKKST